MLRPQMRTRFEEKSDPKYLSLTDYPSSKKRKKRKKRFNKIFASFGLPFLGIMIMLAIFNILEFNIRFKKSFHVMDFETLKRYESEAITLLTKSRTCTSPEMSLPWILDGQCDQDPNISILNNDRHQRSCGLCGESASYLRSVRDEIETKYKDKCKDLVVYGACLGQLCEKLLTKKNEWDVVKKDGSCFFLLVGGMNETAMSSNAFQFNNIINIELTKMPYTNSRRNVKVLKFSPGLLFPWADRVIWQDAKVPSKWDFQLPKDYMLHFTRTVEHHGTCVSFMGLPLHESSIGDAANVTLSAQCGSIIAAVEGRPSVSDSIDSVRIQCEEYINTKVSQTPLVDTAFIVYDMRSPTCRKYNGNMLCSWLDEIHCHSDRDQISFPFIIDSMGLKLSTKLDIPGKEYRDQIYVNSMNDAIMHISKRSCHWYYSSFSRCVASSAQINDMDIIKQNHYLSPPGKKKRVAIVVAGTLQRFMFNSTLEHLIKPMKNLRGPRVGVDYYVGLTTAKAKAYRSNSGYTSYFDPDPILPRSELSDHADIEEFIRDRVGRLGGQIGALILKESIDIDSEPLLKARREKELRKHPDQDPDVKFPVIDIRNADIEYRTANANRNLLRMHLSIQNLWEQAVKWEQEEGFKYDYILFMRDDSLWLDDFNIDKLYGKKTDIFVPSCDDREIPMDPSEMNDHILVTTRKFADLFGNYYTTLHHSDVTKCMDQLPDYLTKKNGKGNKKRGCNSEMLLKFVVDENRIVTTTLPQSNIPFQRSGNINIPNLPQMQCFHKYCQSKDSPMDTKNMKECKKVDWDFLLKIAEEVKRD